MAEPFDLRENIPHPVGFFAAGFKLTQRGFIHRILGGDEAVKVVFNIYGCPYHAASAPEMRLKAPELAKA